MPQPKSSLAIGLPCHVTNGRISPDKDPPPPQLVCLRNLPSFSWLSTNAPPSWTWPQGWSMRQSTVRSGMTFWNGLAMPVAGRQATSGLVSAVPGVLVTKPVFEQAAMPGTVVVSSSVLPLGVTPVLTGLAAATQNVEFQG